MNQKA